MTPDERRREREYRRMRAAMWADEYRWAVKRQRERAARDRMTYPVFVAVLLLYAIGLIVWILWW